MVRIEAEWWLDRETWEPEDEVISNMKILGAYETSIDFYKL